MTTATTTAPKVQGSHHLDDGLTRYCKKIVARQVGKGKSPKIGEPVDYGEEKCVLGVHRWVEAVGVARVPTMESFAGKSAEEVEDILGRTFEMRQTHKCTKCNAQKLEKASGSQSPSSDGAESKSETVEELLNEPHTTVSIEPV